ncbi:MAG: hypothetical protein ACXWQO_15310 [Bdellovibrionota bacterium]
MKLLFAFLLLALSSSAIAGKFQEPTDSEIKSALETFKFRGAWILPSIIHEFLPLESDYTLPLVTAIDVGAATGTNRFFGEVSLQKGKGGVEEPSHKTSEGETIRYRYVGKLKNGLHVLEAWSSGSGSLVATDLLVFGLRENSAFDEQGKTYKQLLLELKRIVTLGDRAIAEIRLNGNEIEVNTEFNNNRKPEQKKIIFPENGKNGEKKTITWEEKFSLYVKDLPPEIAELLRRKDTCDHFANEPVYDEQRKNEIVKKLESAKCHSVDGDLKAAEIKYQTNQMVLTKIKNFPAALE